MEIGDGEAEASGGLEAAGGSVHANGRRGERVVGWEDQCAPILAVVVGSLLRSCDHIVPSKGDVLVCGWVWMEEEDEERQEGWVTQRGDKGW